MEIVLPRSAWSSAVRPALSDARRKKPTGVRDRNYGKIVKTVFENAVSHRCSLGPGTQGLSPQKHDARSSLGKSLKCPSVRRK